jgi:hypothetical protein
VAWAEAYRTLYGAWPTVCSGLGARAGRWPSCTGKQVHGAPGETWVNVNQALTKGLRGLPGGDTLPRLLARERGRRHIHAQPRLTAWALAHRARTGRWPNAKSGPVEGAPGETWSAVREALRQGLRGLPRGSLPWLLARRFGARNPADLPRLTERQILRWADAHREGARSRCASTRCGAAAARRRWRRRPALSRRPGPKRQRPGSYRGVALLRAGRRGPRRCGV